MKTVRHAVAFVATMGMFSSALADHHLKPVDLTGVWNVKAITDDNVREITWTFKKANGKLKGESFDHENDTDQDIDRIDVKEKKVTLGIDIEVDGNTGVIMIEAEEKSTGKLTGDWKVVGSDGTEYMSGKLSATKRVAFAGKWETVATMGNGNEVKAVMELQGKGSSLEGKFDGDAGELELDKVSVKDNALRVQFEFEMNGNTINCVIEAEPHGNDKLVGKWLANRERRGMDGHQEASGIGRSLGRCRRDPR